MKPPPAASSIPLLRLLVALLLGFLLIDVGGGLLWIARAPGGFAWAVPGCAGAMLLVAFALGLVCLDQAHMAERMLAESRQEMARPRLGDNVPLSLQRSDAVGPLTRGIVHDFNNQLTTISTSVELLARRLPAELASLRRLTDTAMQGVQRAATLSHRLLALSRQQEPDPEPLDLGRLLNSMSHLLRRMLGESVRVETGTTEGLWLVWADATQFEAMLLHLAANGRENMPEGGTLSIAVDNLTLAPGDPELPPGQYVTLTVSDTGVIALPADAEARLAAAAGFARQSRGLVRSLGRNGMRLYFPRFVPHPSAQPLVSVRRDSGSKTILVVEDDDDLRQAAAEALRQLGYTVLEAADAMQGIQLIADRGGIDLLLTDIGLPGGVDGRALADAARSAAPELKVLFTTGYREAAGDRLLLPKPFSLDQLAAKVRQALGIGASEPALVAASGFGCPSPVARPDPAAVGEPT